MKYAVGLWLFGQLSDRFLVYHPPKNLEEKIEGASKIKGINGIEVMYPAEFKYDEIDYFKSLIKNYGLEVAAIIVDLFGQSKWFRGSLTSKDERIRREAIQTCKEAMDVAKELGCRIVNIWPGQDGYDYPLQADYSKLWDLFTDAIREIATHDRAVKVALEYKLKEPRTRILISSVGKALLLVNDVNMDNVGITLDIGHALQALENPAESLVLIYKRGKLFHVHANDNYRDWDHDLITCTVNLWDYVECFFWLKRLGYDGWISIDIYPYREDVRGACEESIAFMRQIEQIVDKVGIRKFEECIEDGDPIKISKLLREILDT
jgi:xylose isomerase